MSKTRPSIKDVDETLKEWRQGDFVLDFHSFFSLTTTDRANTRNSDNSVNSIVQEESVHGIVVVSQSCDIVRSYQDRPQVEVCPLVKVSDHTLNEVERCRTPQFAYLLALADDNLVVDLNRTMTLDKRLLIKCERRVGCTNDEQKVSFANALARKRSRFAFPDDFAVGTSKFRDRMQVKHNKNSVEGATLRSIQEIRVLAVPSWDAPNVALELYFVLRDDIEVSREEIARQITAWEKLLNFPDRYGTVDTYLVTLDDMSAREYVASQRLDLEHLSAPATS